MKEILFGVISGIVAALGMGGGTILILLLGIFTNLEQHLIQGTNLIFFIPTSLVAIFMNIKNKTINYKLALNITIAGILGAIVGCKLSFKIENNALKKYFGYFLILIALFEIFMFFRKYIIKEKEDNN